MPYPEFPSDGVINTISEFDGWSLSAPTDAAEAYAKLVFVGLQGVSMTTHLRDDSFQPPDLFCQQLNGWYCFYVATPAAGGEARVVTLLTAPGAPMPQLEAEAKRRRRLFGV